MSEGVWIGGFIFHFRTSIHSFTRERKVNIVDTSVLWWFNWTSANFKWLLGNATHLREVSFQTPVWWRQGRSATKTRSKDGQDEPAVEILSGKTADGRIGGQAGMPSGGRKRFVAEEKEREVGFQREWIGRVVANCDGERRKEVAPFEDFSGEAGLHVVSYPHPEWEGSSLVLVHRLNFRARQRAPLKKTKKYER